MSASSTFLLQPQMSLQVQCPMEYAEDVEVAILAVLVHDSVAPIQEDANSTRRWALS
jgi:hypothetical protein